MSRKVTNELDAARDAAQREHLARCAAGASVGTELAGIAPARADVAAELAATFRKAPPKPPLEQVMEELRAKFKDVPTSTAAELHAHHFRTRIAPAIRRAGFETRYQVDAPLAGTDPRAALQRAALAKVRACCTGTGAIVALIGPRGTGKTTLAAALCTAMAWEDFESVDARDAGRIPYVLCRDCIYTKLTAVVGRFKEYYGDMGSIREPALVAMRDALCRADILIIDELHEVGEDSRHKERILADILDRRYAARRDTLLISNETYSAFCANISPSILSRLNEHGGIMPCEWQSFRERAAVNAALCEGAKGNDEKH